MGENENSNQPQDDSAIEEVLTAMSKVFENAEKNKHADVVENFLETFGTDFSLRDFVHYTTAKECSVGQIEAIAVAVGELKGVSPDDMFRYRTFHSAYGFIRRHLRNLFEEFEGSFACNDKAVHMAAVYRTRIEGGTNGLTPVDKKYYMPELEVYELWHEMVDSLLMFNLGRREGYLRDLAELEKFYQDLSRKMVGL